MGTGVAELCLGAYPGFPVRGRAWISDDCQLLSSDSFEEYKMLVNQWTVLVAPETRGVAFPVVIVRDDMIFLVVGGKTGPQAVKMFQ